MERIDITVTGGCQCGAVRYRATQMLDNAHICHCRMCQKAVGNLFAALVAAPNEALTWTRGAPAAFRSSEHVDRGFCAACGTPLTYWTTNYGPTIDVTTASLDDPEAFPPVAHVWTSHKLGWVKLADGLPCLEEDSPSP